jgi:hypothetical protein
VHWTAVLPARLSDWRVIPERSSPRHKEQSVSRTFERSSSAAFLIVFSNGYASSHLRSVQNRIVDLLDSWRKIFEDYRVAGVNVQYQKYELKQPKPLLREILDKDFESERHRKFRANRSLRDVEPEVNLFLKDLSGMEVEEQA